MTTAAPQTDERFEFIQRLASDLSAGQIELPSFPDVVLRVRRALEDEDCSTEKLVQLIGAEPVLAARLLNIANSAALRPSGDAITNLSMAVTRIGRVMVRSSAMSFAMEQMRANVQLELGKNHLERLWNQCAYVAALCYVLARKFTRLNADEAMFVGLMHGIGRMYVIVRAEDFPSIFADDEAFASIMEEWDAAIGASIIENWGFAEHVSTAVRDFKDTHRNHEGDADYTDVLILAHLFYQFMHAEDDAEFVLDEVPASERLNIAATDMIAIMSESEAQIRSLQRALGKAG